MTQVHARRPATARNAKSLLHAIVHTGTSTAEVLDTSAPVRPVTGYSLTTREAQVALWVSRGKTNYEIGVILSISVRTIEKHVEHVLQKLGVENRTTAALLVAERFLSPPQT
jgi:DNA-binding CsgD family transcriptional regulator